MGAVAGTRLVIEYSKAHLEPFVCDAVPCIFDPRTDGKAHLVMGVISYSLSNRNPQEQDFSKSFSCVVEP
jgi:hypothetical protein